MKLDFFHPILLAVRLAIKGFHTVSKDTVEL